MDPLLTIVTAVVAVVASSVGVIVAVDQLTLRARLRRTAEATLELTKQEENENRKAVLHSIHDVAVARLAAGWTVAWWHFAEFAVWFAIGPVALGFSAARFGWTGPVQVTLASTFPIIAIAARRSIRIYSERQRIARQYLAGVHVAPPRLGMLQQMEGGVRAEFLRARLSAVVRISLALAPVC